MIAEDRYSARDALGLIDVSYEPLPVVVDARRALDADRDAGRDPTATASSTGRRATPPRPSGCFAARRGRGRPGHGVPALASRADGDLRRRGRLRPHRRQGDAVVHDAGAARPPHAVLADHRPGRAQDPRDLARCRRRLRQQGPGLPRLRLRLGRRDGARPAGEVGRGPQREPDVHRLRPRLHDARADRRHPRGQDPGARRRRDRRPRRVQRRRPAVALPRGLLLRLHRLLRRRRRALPRHRRVHQQGAGWRGVLVLVPDRRGRLSRRAARRLPRARAGQRPCRPSAPEPASARSSSRTRARRAGSTTPATTRRRWTRRSRWRVTTRCAPSRRRSAHGAS